MACLKVGSCTNSGGAMLLFDLWSHQSLYMITPLVILNPIAIFKILGLYIVFNTWDA